MSILWRSTKAPTVSSVESRKCSESQAEQRKGGSKLSDPTLLGIFHPKERFFQQRVRVMVASHKSVSTRVQRVA